MKNLLLTGASGNIGQAIAQLFLSKGYKVTAPTRQELDLCDPQNIDNYFNQHSLEYLAFIHCAGYNTLYSLEALKLCELQKTLQINTLSFFQILSYLIPFFKQKKKGYVLGISSLYGTIAREERASYVMSKHAMNGLMQTACLELGSYNIKVNTLSPGFVDTQMTRKNNSLEKIQNLQTKIPLKRLGSVEDIANIAYMLCSEQNTYISGQNIIVDGGFMAGGFQK
ncbi:3-oxoacyl-[acyl-carrier protein] reductase [Brevinema andersonii]|uniref:3-oxoacyl-[acyl-carrier protein] reductase n=1 Tax=Brevinema andersonii TaxID=34097 RepID=A0A1I1EDU8_BREAD|nr:SDR family oxidoreductase [Brevinema andersonii]SFB85309.1 3-oxoacyl-[acyl-carrier protein] reductase [Brevinema andersonii]